MLIHKLLRARGLLAFLALLAATGGTPQALAAQAASTTTRLKSAPGRQVVDIENLRVVNVPHALSSTPTCQVLVVGGGLGGVAAAAAAAEHGMSVILTEPTSHLGGQLTSEGVSIPDENKYIEEQPGPSTHMYRELRDQVRQHYEQMPGVVKGRGWNIGQCWVSDISGEPAVWEQAIADLLTPLERPSGIRDILMRHVLLDVQRYSGNGQVSYADFLDLDTGQVDRVGARYVLDATATGDVLDQAGCPWTIGQEAQSTYNEPDAPPVAHPEWVQSFTYSFIARWTPKAPQPIVAEPDDYDFFKSLGKYSLSYRYPDSRGIVNYDMFTTAPDASGPFWTYRRLIAASSFVDPAASNSPSPVHSEGAGGVVVDSGTPPQPSPQAGREKDSGLPPLVGGLRGVSDSTSPSPLGVPSGPVGRGEVAVDSQDVSLINWQANDYPAENFIGQSPEVQVRILTRAKAYAEGFLYWLQTTCPRDDGGTGYPEIQPAADELGTDGFAPFPYVRESRRLLAVAPLTERDMIPDPLNAGQTTGTDFFDSVGLAYYPIDIHPSIDEAPKEAGVLPYELPLGAFIAASGPTNVLPASLDLGASRLAAASTRVHPTEWLIGEVAGNLAAFCIEHDVLPAQVRSTPELLSAFQQDLEHNGIATRWSEVAAFAKDHP